MIGLLQGRLWRRLTQRGPSTDTQGMLAALHKVQAVIEFDLQGHVLAANDNFLSAMGYTSAQIVGQHHRMFVEQTYAQSASYRDFWGALGRGEFQAGEFLRIGKGSEQGLFKILR